MAQADSNISILASVDPTRRRFLSNAAGVAAGGTVLAMATTHPAPAIASQRVPDPILAAIEAHKAAFADLSAILDARAVLERDLPRERRRSSVDAWEEKIVKTDDPRWIDAERAVVRAFEAEEDASIQLVCIQPTTKAGFFAIMEHALSHDKDGEAWPVDLVSDSDDGKRTRAWHYFLIESLLAARSVLVA